MNKENCKLMETYAPGRVGRIYVNGIVVRTPLNQDPEDGYRAIPDVVEVETTHYLFEIASVGVGLVVSMYAKPEPAPKGWWHRFCAGWARLREARQS